MKILINIDVPDLTSAVDFYTAALGLCVKRIIDEDVAELTGTSAVIYLLQKAAGSKPVNDLVCMREYTRHWTPVHFDFVVNNVEEAASRAIGAGAKQESECVEWMGSKCISFSDPFGHGFCLIEFAGETYSDSVAVTTGWKISRRPAAKLERQARANSATEFNSHTTIHK